MRKNSRHEKAPSAPTLEAHEAERQSIRKNVMSNNSTEVIVDNLPVVCHAGKPVVSTALLARLYGADPKRIQNNFMRNADRFESGKHFFKVVGEELVNLRPSFGGLQVSPKARALILWTERGAARHAKMLETDKAWEVFETLEDSYFGKVANPLPALPAPINYTLIGTTIGSDGFHCLSAVIDGKISRLDKRAKQSARMHIWSQVHKAFSVVSAQDIPADQLDSARNFIAAYVIDGEWLPKREEGGLHFSSVEVQSIYRLMTAHYFLNEHQGQIFSAASALRSSPLMDIADQINGCMLSFDTLNRRRDEIYAACKSRGCNGGYAEVA